MTIAAAHSKYVTERLFLESLKEGMILTTDQLLVKLNEYKEDHPDLSKPVSNYKTFTVEHGGNSSSSTIQHISESISDDVGIVSRELKDMVGKSLGYYERWSIEVQRLTNKSKRLEHDIDSLLLLQSDTAGYFAFVGDNFADMNKIDTANTDAKIDLVQSVVSLNPYTSYPDDYSGGTRLNLSKLTNYDVTFSVLTSTPVGYTTLGKAELLNAFTSPGLEGNNWIGTVSKNEPGEVAAELKVRLNTEEDVEVSRVLFNSSTQNAGGSPTVTCQWSLDGYEWFMVDDTTPTKTLQDNKVSWSFPITKMRWLKFIFIKNNYDVNEAGVYWYEFGARSIRLFGNQYSINDTSTLQTKAQQPVDAEGEPVVFTKASFEACEENTVDANGDQATFIDYYIAASPDGKNSWTEWVRVSPIAEEDSNYPSSVLFGGTNKLDNNTSNESALLEYEQFDPETYLDRLTVDFEWDDSGNKYLGYNFKSLDYAVSNTVISLLSDPSDQDSDLLNANYLANSVEVWRNTFNLDSPGRIVRDINAGWGFEDNEYYCSFYVVSSSGITLNFGDTECVIDGIKRTGEVKIYKGVHSFSTNQNNWYDFYTDSNSYNMTTEEQLISTDTLYPYNHKMILEGFPYEPENFRGEKVYVGVDILAEFYGTKTSAFDLENNIEKSDSLRYFAFVKGVGSDEKPSCAILFRRDLSYNDHSDESCRIIWRAGEGSYRYIRMKAEFRSDDMNKTSTLCAYRIKAGI